MSERIAAVSSGAVPQSARVLLGQILDYAGLFPPADLPLDRAVINYSTYRHVPNAWLLARFVCPAARLADLEAFAHIFDPADPFLVSVLASKSASSEAFPATFAEDLAAIDAVQRRHAGGVRANMVELRLPADLEAADADAVAGWLEGATAQLDATLPGGWQLFVEVPTGTARTTAVPALLAAIDRLDVQARVGCKIRCGGLSRDAYPPSRAVAEIIIACRDAGVAFKGTAGLHHPVRHFNQGADARMHGFLNVFGGAVLARTHGLDADALIDILEDETAAHFRLSGDAFAWKDLHADLEDIRAARTGLACSFGSCSFEEPRDDLRALGILPDPNRS